MKQLKGVSVNAFYFFPIFLAFFSVSEGLKAVLDSFSITALAMMNSSFGVVRWSLTFWRKDIMFNPNFKPPDWITPFDYSN